jgi:type I restriction enzyme S subunit
MEVEEYTFKDLLSRIVDNRGKTCPTADTGTALIATNCIKNEELYPVFEKVRWVDDETMENWFRGHPEPEDILFVTKGSPGRCCLTPDPVNFCIAQDMLALRADEQKVSQRFLFCLLRSSIAQNAIENLHVGTMIPHFKKGDFDQLSFQIPKSRKMQEWIGDLYFRLSYKIELNRRMNETLEGMAQALFKSWFVDFDPVIDNALAAGNPIPEPLAQRAETRRQAIANGTANCETAQAFPASFRFTEELGWIPEGWEVLKLNEVCERIFSGGTPRTKETSYWNGDIPWLSSGETGQRFILRTEKTITKEGVENSSTRQTRKGSVVIASAGQGKTRGQTSYLCFDSYINQSVIALETNNTLLPDSFLFFDLARRYEEFRQISDAHSSRGSLTTKLLAEIDVVTPSGQSLSKFGTYAGESINKISRNAVQAEELSKLRDVLLPKLISGELRIPQAEKMVEEAVA